jgi:Protein of unknown function (DUF2797)
MSFMQSCGQLRKLVAKADSPVSYSLPLGTNNIELAPLLEKQLHLRYTGKITCIHCKLSTNKSFNQGYCYSCFQKLAQCDVCIMSPERCHFEAGTCREPVWGEHFCMQDHIVYFANSSGLKVGITRASQLPTRWLDQGATQAVAAIRVRTRQQAGFCEVLFKEHVTDRTNWRAMLSGKQEVVNMAQERDRLLALCHEDLNALQNKFGLHAINILHSVEPVNFSYPIVSYPDKIISLDFDSQPEMTGCLLGIKGQYLLLDTGVLNIRKYTGYELELTVS